MLFMLMSLSNAWNGETHAIFYPCSWPAAMLVIQNTQCNILQAWILRES